MRIQAYPKWRATHEASLVTWVKDAWGPLLISAERDKWRGKLKPLHVDNVTYQRLQGYYAHAQAHTLPGAMSSFRVSFNLFIGIFHLN